MPTTFSLAGEDDEATIICQKMMAAYHLELTEVKAKIGIIYCKNDDGPAVRHGGYGAAAKIKVVALKDRLAKGYDAEMLIDETIWKEFTVRKRNALIDHELEHLRAVKKENEETGEEEYQYDDIGRPKLRVAKADFYAGDAFQTVISRHGEDAIEVGNAENFYRLVKASVKSQGI